MKWFFIFLIFLQSSISFAALGDRENSVKKDAKTLKGKLQLLNNENYSTHIIKTSTYTAKEFVSNDGDVFAVSWRGIRHPKLSILLGANYNEYKNSFSNRAVIPGSRSTKIQTSRAVIEQFGHSSDIRGFAYIADLVPSNVNLGDLK